MLWYKVMNWGVSLFPPRPSLYVGRNVSPRKQTYRGVMCVWVFFQAPDAHNLCATIMESNGCHCYLFASVGLYYGSWLCDRWWTSRFAEMAWNTEITSVASSGCHSNLQISRKDKTLGQISRGEANSRFSQVAEIKCYWRIIWIYSLLKIFLTKWSFSHI